MSTRAEVGALLAAFACVAGVASSAGAQPLDVLFAQGKDAYVDSRFDDAVGAWERLREAGVRDPDVEANLGLAHARAGRLGAAALSFERSLALRSDGEVRAALVAVRDALGERRADRDGEAMVETSPGFAEALVAPFTEPTLALLVLGFEALLLLLLLLLLTLPRLRAALVTSAALVALLLLLAGVGLLVKRGAFDAGTRGIVLVDELSLREAPDDRTAARGQVHEGERVSVLDEDDEFVLVRVRERRGWVRRDGVGTLD